MNHQQLFGEELKIAMETARVAAFRFIDGYSLTAVGAADCTQLITAGGTKPGVVTPSLLIGHRYMDQFVMEKII
jgi:hypothetical protein